MRDYGLSVILSFALVVAPTTSARAQGSVVSDLAEILGTAGLEGISGDLGNTLLMLKALNEFAGMARQAKRVTDGVFAYRFDDLRADALYGFEQIDGMRAFTAELRETGDNLNLLQTSNDEFWNYYASADSRAAAYIRSGARAGAMMSMQQVLFPETEFGEALAKEQLTATYQLLQQKYARFGESHKIAKEQLGLVELVRMASKAHAQMQSNEEASVADTAETLSALIAGKSLESLVSIKNNMEMNAAEAEWQKTRLEIMQKAISDARKARREAQDADYRKNTLIDRPGAIFSWGEE